MPLDAPFELFKSVMDIACPDNLEIALMPLLR